MTPTVASIMLIALFLTGCAGAKRVQTAETHTSQERATSARSAHAVQTSNGESQTIANDGLEMEWLRVEYYPPDSTSTEPAIKSEERGRARRQRQEQRNESVTVATEENRSDSLMTETESHSKSDRTEIKERSNGIKTWLWLIVAGAIAGIFLYRKYLQNKK